MLTQVATKAQQLKGEKKLLITEVKSQRKRIQELEAALKLSQDQNLSLNASLAFYSNHPVEAGAPAPSNSASEQTEPVEQPQTLSRESSESGSMKGGNQTSAKGDSITSSPLPSPLPVTLI